MSKQLPLYRCHKLVRAAQIERIEAFGERTELGLTSGLTVEVGASWMRKHSPYVRGYYVLSDDGYESFSPAKSFEDGYARVDEPEGDEHA